MHVDFDFSWLAIAVIVALVVSLLLLPFLALRRREQPAPDAGDARAAARPRRSGGLWWLGLLVIGFVVFGWFFAHDTRVLQHRESTPASVFDASGHGEAVAIPAPHEDSPRPSPPPVAPPAEPRTAPTAISKPAPGSADASPFGLVESARVQILVLVILAVAAVVLYAARGRPRLVFGLTLLAAALAIPVLLYFARQYSTREALEAARLEAERDAARHAAELEAARSRRISARSDETPAVTRAPERAQRPVASGEARERDEARVAAPGTGTGTNAVRAERRSSASSERDATVLTDDRTLWLRAGELADHAGRRVWIGIDETTPSWVLNAGGARLEPRRLGSREVEVWVPNFEQQLVGYSDVTESADSAIREARDRAAEKLAALALLELEPGKAGLEKSGVDTAWPLALRVALDRLPELEADLYTESAERSYATVYRAAVLANVPSGEAQALASEIAGDLARGWLAEQDELRGWLWITVSVILLGIAIFLLHTFVNAGTKGYFAWPLRLASGGLFVLLSIALYFARERLFS